MLNRTLFGYVITINKREIRTIEIFETNHKLIKKTLTNEINIMTEKRRNKSKYFLTKYNLSM